MSVHHKAPLSITSTAAHIPAARMPKGPIYSQAFQKAWIKEYNYLKSVLAMISAYSLVKPSAQVLGRRAQTRSMSSCFGSRGSVGLSSFLVLGVQSGLYKPKHESYQESPEGIRRARHLQTGGVAARSVSSGPSGFRIQTELPSKAGARVNQLEGSARFSFGQSIGS